MLKRPTSAPLLWPPLTIDFFFFFFIGLTVKYSATLTVRRRPLWIWPTGWREARIWRITSCATPPQSCWRKVSSTRLFWWVFFWVGGLGSAVMWTSPAANFHCKPSVLMVDELLSAYPHQLSFSEAGMRIMITSHFSPRTRLTMASRMLINEVRTPPTPSRLS